MTTPPDLSDFTKEEIRETLDEVRHPFDVAIYSSENYFNMASIVRTCHANLCAKIWQVDFTKMYKRATMGTHKWENLSKVTLNEFLEQNTDRNIVVFERNDQLDTEDIRYFQYPENPILFFGSEKFGVPDEVLNTASNIVSIPMFGIHNDLNISVAAGIVMYDFILKMSRENIFNFDATKEKMDQERRAVSLKTVREG